MLSDCFKEGVLEKIVIKNVKLPQSQMTDNCNLELRILKALSNPQKNSEMYKSIRHLEITINNCNDDLNANPNFFDDHYSDILDFFSKVGLSKDTYIQTCNLEVIKLTTSTPSRQIRRILDKVLGEHLPPMSPRNIQKFEVSSTVNDQSNCPLISDKIA